MERPHYNLNASGARMRAIRKQRNISVRQVMEYMGFESTQAVYKWESGKCFPQADNLLALAILYHVSPMELLVEEDLVSSFHFYVIWSGIDFYMIGLHNITYKYKEEGNCREKKQS